MNCERCSATLSVMMSSTEVVPRSASTTDLAPGHFSTVTLLRIVHH